MDEEVAHSKIINGKLKTVETYTNIPYEQPFLKKPVNIDYVKYLLKRRAVSPCKSDIKEVHLNDSEIIEILKETHGVSYNDFLWIKFDNESLIWNDVRLR